jgi:hypothetical protein
MTFDRLDKEAAKATLSTLIEKYKAQRHELEKLDSKYTETEARGEFIDPFLALLGWDVHNQAGLKQSLREVILEHAADEETFVAGRPDYRLRVDGRDRLPVEAKKPSVALGTSARSSEQARSYGFSLSLPAGLLTNFAETVLFDTRIEPVDGDLVDVAVIPGLRIKVDDYLDNFDLLWDYLAFENVSNNACFNALHDYEAPPRGTSPFDLTFLRHFRGWRLSVAQEIATQNPALGPAEIGRRTQRVLNALLFLRVCEDRDIWKYERLLRSAKDEKVVEAFAEADRVFNAGLFTVLRDTTVRPQLLRGIISEMYWPRTKFAFGVMRPDVLAGLYEQYLAERVEISPTRTVTLVPKPELTHSGGVIPTPEFIVDALVQHGFDGALDPAREAPADLTVVDPACGSGIFLLAAFDVLLQHAEEVQASTLASRGKLVQDHLFGVDIDGEAVEVSRLSLLLAVLGEAHVGPKSDRDVLPDLSANIRAGNAVIGDDFDAHFPAVAAIPFRRTAVSPASWASLFPAVIAAGGFSVLLANPPYVRIQTLQEFLPDQLAYFQDARSGYGSAGSFNFDLYMIFIERALTLLKPGGRLAMIVPNRFTSVLAGTTVREQLGSRLKLLVHFGEIQIFPGRLTYTALIVAGDRTTGPATFEIVTDLDDWKAGAHAQELVTRATLTSAPWPIATAARTAIFDRMIAVKIAYLSDPTWVKIFVGVQTSADEIFFVTPSPNQPNPSLLAFTDVNGNAWAIERTIVRPALKKKRLHPFDARPEPDQFAIFPYVVSPPAGTRTKASATVVDPATMASTFPRALAYFQAHRAKLARRNISPDPGPAFWAYGRSQSLAELDDPKIILRTLSLSPQYVSDPDGLLVPGGGDGGPYTLLRVRPGAPYSEAVIIAILSHPAVDAFVASRGKAYQGSYVVHRKAFLAEVPIPPLTAIEQAAIEQAVVELQSIAQRLRTETDAAVTISLNQRAYLVRERVETTIAAAYRLTAADMSLIVG